VPEFNPGAIIIGSCDCSRQGDLDGDSDIDAVDIIHLICYALQGRCDTLPADPSCPCANRGDWNCDGIVNMLDIVKMVNYVYRWPAPLPCDPCPCMPNPGACCP